MRRPFRGGAAAGAAAALALLAAPPCLAAGTSPQDGRARALLVEQARAFLEASAPEADDPQGTAAALLDALAAEPASPFGEGLAAALAGALERAPRREEILRRASQLLQHPSLHGLARLRLAAALAGEEEDAEEGEEAAEPAEDVSGEFASFFLVAGPFGDAGTYFHGVPFPPEEGSLDPERPLPGRFGPVRWRPVHRGGAGRSVRLDRRGPRTDGCHYALHQVDAPRATPAWLEVSSAGSLEVFVNGRHALDVDRLSRWHPSRHFVPVLLREGRNHVLVKLTAPWSTRFSLRYVDAMGRTLEGLVEEQGSRVVPPAPPAPAEEPPGALRDGVQELLEAAGGHGDEDGDGAAALEAAAGLWTVMLGLSSEGLERVEAAYGRGGGPLLAMAHWTALENARHLPRDLVRNRQRTLLAEVLEARPGHATATLRHAAALTREDRKEDALRLLVELKEAHPDGLMARRALLELYRSLSWEAEERLLLQESLARFPDQPDLVLHEARWLEEADDLPAAVDRIRRALEHRPHHGRLLRSLRDLLARTGDVDGAEEALLAANRRGPDRYEVLMGRASLLSAHPRTLGRARDLLVQAAAKEPEAVDPHLGLGEIALRLDRAGEAAEHFREALARDPSRHQLRTRLARLLGEQELPELGAWDLDAMAHALSYRPDSRDGTAPSTLVLDQMVVRVYEDGSSVEETHILRRINDHRGVDEREEADRAAAADELLALRTITPQGETFVPVRVGDSFSMPRLAPGVFVEERYRNFQRSPGARPWSVPTFYFQSPAEPFVFSRYVIILPEGITRGRFARNLFPEEPEVVRGDGWVASVFLKTDMPRLREEDGAPPFEEILPWVTWGEDRPWEETGRELLFSLARETRGSREVDRAARDIVEGTEGDRARLEALWAFVQQEIPTEGSLKDPTGVLLRREGSRWHLLAAFLRSAGVPWRFAVFRPFSPETDPRPEPAFAGGSFFARPALLVEPRDGEPVWVLDGLPRHYPLGAVPAGLGRSMERARGLVLSPTGVLPAALPGTDPLDHATLRAWVDVALEATGDAAATARLLFPGTSGYTLKEQVRGMAESMRRAFASQVARRVLPGWTLREAEFLGLDQDGEPLRAALTLARNGALERAGGSFLLPLPLDPSELTQGFAGSPTREQPFVWDRHLVTDLTVTLDPGDHFAVSALPRSLSLRRHILDYGLSFQRRDRKLVLHRRLLLSPGRIAPAEFPSWLAACRAVDDAEAQRIPLSPTTPTNR